jgi:IS5 family transposase
VDSESGLIHSVETTTANVHELTPAADLLHGDETVVYADAGYQGIEKRDEMQDRGSASASPCDPGSAECCQTRRRVDWMIWSKPLERISAP